MPADARPSPAAAPGPEPATSGPAPAPGPARYVRHRDLPRLVALWPWELETPDRAARQRLLARLRRALREERRRGRAGHWAYDLGRHARLLAAYRAEVALCLSSEVSRDRTRCVETNRA